MESLLKIETCERMEKSGSVDELLLGYGNHVSPLLPPRSPPAPRTIVPVEGDPETWRDPIAEAHSEGGEPSSRPIAIPNQLSVCALSIPTVSIEDVDQPLEQPLLRRSSVNSSTSLISEKTNISSGSILKRAENIGFTIHRLVAAFAVRAQIIKKRIVKPATPSTVSSAGSRAPGPPPLNHRRLSLMPNYDENSDNLRCTSTIHPQSSLFLCWLLLVTAAFVYNVVVIPLRVAFPLQDDSNVLQWLVADYLCDAVYLADVGLVRPRVRFVRHGLWVDQQHQTRRHYARSFGFKLDVAVLIPTDLLYLYFGVHTPALRLPRMLKIMSFWELFDRLDMMVAWPLALRICRTLSYLMYLIHVKACVYYVFSTVRGLASTSFVFQGKTDAYIRCFYFAMKTAAKIGKNPKPVDIVEETFMIFNWLIGVLACAAIIGQIRDITAAADRTEAEFRDRLDRTTNLMNRLNLPSRIQNRVRLWFDYTKSTQKTFDETAALAKLPLKMQMDVALSVHIDTLSKVKLFHDCDKVLLRDLVLKLRPVLYLPGEMVCTKGQVGKEMYIVKTGMLEVISGVNNDVVLATLTEGSVFGEISLLALGVGNRRTADVRSKGFSNLFVLSKDDLNEIVQDYPDTQRILQHKANKLVKRNSKREDLMQQQAQQIQIFGKKPPTPKFVRTVIQVLAPSSRTGQIFTRHDASSARQRTSLQRQSAISEDGDSQNPQNVVILESTIAVPP